MEAIIPYNEHFVKSFLSECTLVPLKKKALCIVVIVSEDTECLQHSKDSFIPFPHARLLLGNLDIQRYFH